MCRARPRWDSCRERSQSYPTVASATSRQNLRPCLWIGRLPNPAFSCKEMSVDPSSNLLGQKLGVSVVVCCHNSAQLLPATLAHLKAQRGCEGIPWEVVLVD